MLKNYLKTAFRNLFRFKVYSFINIVGLALGMGTCLIIFVFVLQQYSYDNFNKKADRIYRINLEAKINGKQTKLALTPPSLGPYLESQFPQIESVVRLYAYDVLTSIGNPAVAYRDKALRANRFILVDSTFFKVFSFKMLQGGPKNALNAPFSVVLTKDAAQKLFGDENPVGKTLLYNNKIDFTVTGVVQNPPANSTIQFDYLGSLSSLPHMPDQPNGVFDYYTYVLLNKSSNVKEIQQRVPQVVLGFWSQAFRSVFGSPTVHLEALRNLYWDKGLQYDIPVKGSKTSVVVFSEVAILILLIACINFINLSTARGLARAKEIGIRKVIGAKRRQLIGQFLMESGSTSFIASLASIMLSELLIPIVNKHMGMSLPTDYLRHYTILLSIAGIWTFTTVSAGALPALYLSSFQPASVMRGNVGKVVRTGFSRQFFTVFQFSAAIAIIFSTIVVVKQFELLRSHSLGFNKDNIVVLNYNQTLAGDYAPLKQKLLVNPRVLGVTAANGVPGGAIGLSHYFFRVKSVVEQGQFHDLAVDPDYIPVFGLKLLAGRNFSSANPSDEADAFIINKSAAKELGLTPEEAIGKPFGDNQSDLINEHIVGVVQDFNFQSLRNKVEPLVLEVRNNFRVLAVKISPYEIPATLNFIEETWKKVVPNIPIEYNFLNKDLAALYRSEQKLDILFMCFSLFSIFIACLGLYGLALYTAERKRKEIGIRKALGSSTSQIVFLLSKNFAKWVVIANAVAWPVAYYFMNKWLSDYAYRVNVAPWIFLASGAIALVIAIATVSLQAIRAAVRNPIESLRYE